MKSVLREIGWNLYAIFVAFPLQFRTYTASVCGHRTRRFDVIEAYGEERRLMQSLNYERSVDYCSSCHVKMAIKCGRCTRPIFTGDDIYLWKPLPDYTPPNDVVLYEEGDLIFVIACTRPSCAGNMPPRSGMWIPPGEVLRIPSALQRAQENRTPLTIGRVLWPDGHPIKERPARPYQRLKTF